MSPWSGNDAFAAVDAVFAAVDVVFAAVDVSPPPEDPQPPAPIARSARSAAVPVSGLRAAIAARA